MDYTIATCQYVELSEDERTACNEIIARGGAVNPTTAAAELTRAALIAVARGDQRVVAVGAIKASRPAYARTIAQRSAFAFDENMHELGYVAVDDAHRNQHLSTRIVEALLAAFKDPLFATTSSERMKHLNRKLGFTQHGREWPGHTSVLSLWIRRV